MSEELTFAEKIRTVSFGKVPGGARHAERVITDKQVRPMREPSWEKGVVRDQRGVPYISERDMTPITVKQFENKRPHYEGAIERLRQDPNPLT